MIFRKKQQADLAKFLQSRRSAKAKYLTEPGPDNNRLKEILTIAARVPDHGKLSPFYFIVFEGEGRARFGQYLCEAWAKDHPDATEDQLDYEAARLTRAPIVVAVISRIRPSKIPLWEQMMSAGACCYNLCLAANSFGYGASWLTEWYSYHDHIRSKLSLDNDRDTVAGFIYIGTEKHKQDDRTRPDLDAITNFWAEGQFPDNKGDIYDKVGMSMPFAGFQFGGRLKSTE